MNASPDLDTLLEQATLFLDKRQDRRGVIRLVERWAEQGQPTRAALVAEARAFLDLRLMDRAWLRLKEAAEGAPDDVETLSLTASMFIERGWPVRARKLLARALELEPANTSLHTLLKRAHQPPLQPPSNAEEIERGGDPAARLALAERFLCAGSRLRAKNVLEQLRKERIPSQVRVEALIWALEGDFSVEEQDLHRLAHRLVPTLDRLARPEEDEPFYGDDEVTSTGRSNDAEEGDVASFPSLFRRVADEGADPQLFADDEVTAISQMGDPEDLRQFVAEERTDPEIDSFELASDTQIMMVIRQDEQDAEVDFDEPDTQTLNLKRFQLKPPPPASSSLDDDDDDEFLEEEDEDLIVMTRREEPAKAPPPVSDAPLEIVEKFPTPYEIPSEPPSAPPSPIGAAFEVEEPIDFTPSAQRAFGRLGIALAILGLVALIVSWGWGTYQSTLTSQRLEESLARGSFRSLQEGEARFEQRVAGEPSSDASAGLAHVQFVLWAEYTGDAERRRSAESQLEASRGSGGGEMTQLAEAWRFFYMGDLSAAQAAAEAQGHSPEVTLLQARIAASHGEVAEAVALSLAALEQAPERPRSLIWLARTCFDAQDSVCVDGALDALNALYPDDQGFALLDLELRSRPPAEALAEADALLSAWTSASPREAGRLHGLRARLLSELDRNAEAQIALKQALNTDPDNPENLYPLALQLLSNGDTPRALSLLERCVEARPRDWRYRTGALFAMIDTEHIDRARELVAESRSLLADDPRLAVLEAAQALWGEDDPAAAKAALENTSLENMPAVEALAGLILGVATEGAGADLREIADQFTQHSDPLLHALAPRAMAWRARYTEGEAGDALAQSLVDSAPADPMVWVVLGSRAEALKNRDRAADLFARAAEQGPEVARVHYERGLFYMDARDNFVMTKRSWSRYMSLDPTGPRAEAVRRRGLH